MENNKLEIRATDRRVLGKEKITMLDGSEKEVNFYAISFKEKNNIMSKHTKVETDNRNTQKYNTDAMSIMIDTLELGLQNQVEFSHIDCNSDLNDYYKKYYTKGNIQSDAEKKEVSSD